MKRRVCGPHRAAEGRKAGRCASFPLGAFLKALRRSADAERRASRAAPGSGEYVRWERRMDEASEAAGDMINDYVDRYLRRGRPAD